MKIVMSETANIDLCTHEILQFALDDGAISIVTATNAKDDFIEAYLPPPPASQFRPREAIDERPRAQGLGHYLVQHNRED